LRYPVRVAAASVETEAQLEDILSRPSDADIEAMRALDGDLLILGVGGKMGPSLAALAKRACAQAGVQKRIIGASRFSDPDLRDHLESGGIETIACDLLDRKALDALPDCPNIVFMAGQKFGTAGNQAFTWAMNTHLPTLVAERFRASRIVAFSSANVYPFVPVRSGGCREEDPVGPIGEYAQSVLGRERMFEYFSARYRTPLTLLRLSYAVELRYGVLRDVAEKVLARRPIDLSTGHASIIWQGDANSVALRSFSRCAVPPMVLNLSGREIVSIRSLAQKMGEALGIAPVFSGSESETALLVNTARCWDMFGAPGVGLDQMITWVSRWAQLGGRSLGKPTHYEARDGRF
jgi:nucleoside-diphosphate-sugar epimerase